LHTYSVIKRDLLCLVSNKNTRSARCSFYCRRTLHTQQANFFDGPRAEERLLNPLFLSLFLRLFLSKKIFLNPGPGEILLYPHGLHSKAKRTCPRRGNFFSKDERKRGKWPWKAVDFSATHSLQPLASQYGRDV
jgi:hypothetical protein